MPTRADIAAFCASPQWVDLYQEVKRLFIVPGSLRLKAVAPVAGFRWRDPEPGGENSMAWYIAATAQDAPSARHRQRILDYNEDDVRATWALRQWMSQHPEAMPTAAEFTGQSTS
jgi:predicted RecB family nuclease